MHITTWNINGLRAALGKGLPEWLENDPPQGLCLQEGRARPDQIEASALQRLQQIYPHSTWNPAQRPGYSGVATFAQLPPKAVRLELGRPDFDAEGRLAAWHIPLGDGEKFWLYNVYFPNGGRDLQRVPFKLEFYARLLEVCAAQMAAGEGVAICGDFNTAHREIDLKNARSNRKHTGFLPEECAWIDRYLEAGFTDIYRRLYPQRVQYTWWAQFANARKNNVGWRLDFFLISPGLVARTRDAIIHDEVPGSDHCPVSWVVE
jgi:exodeoxyribonuclease III